MSERVNSVSDNDFDTKVLGAEQPVLVDFWAPWCGPCRVVGPVMEELAEERGDAVKVYKVNVDESTKVAAQMGIRSIPTVMLFDGGELQETMVGARPRAHFEKMLDDYLTQKRLAQN
jgi:thioredoxin 1